MFTATEIKNTLDRNKFPYKKIEVDKNEVRVIMGMIASGKKWNDLASIFYKLFPDGKYRNKDIYLQGE